MTRIAIAPPHRRNTSSWGWAITERPVPISLAGAERAVMRLSTLPDRRATSWQLGAVLLHRSSFTGTGSDPPAPRHCSAIVKSPQGGEPPRYGALQTQPVHPLKRRRSFRQNSATVNVCTLARYLSVRGVRTRDRYRAGTYAPSAKPSSTHL
jgi:hypothetical protein